MTALAEEPNVPPAWIPLAAHATREGFDVVATNAASEAEVEEARRHAVFASGPAFAPPRLVKPELFAARPAAAA